MAPSLHYSYLAFTSTPASFESLTSSCLISPNLDPELTQLSDFPHLSHRGAGMNLRESQSRVHTPELHCIRHWVYSSLVTKIKET